MEPRSDEQHHHFQQQGGSQVQATLQWAWKFVIGHSSSNGQAAFSVSQWHAKGCGSHRSLG